MLARCPLSARPRLLAETSTAVRPEGLQGCIATGAAQFRASLALAAAGGRHRPKPQDRPAAGVERPRRRWWTRAAHHRGALGGLGLRRQPTPNTSKKSPGRQGSFWPRGCRPNLLEAEECFRWVAADPRAALCADAAAPRLKLRRPLDERVRRLVACTAAQNGAALPRPRPVAPGGWDPERTRLALSELRRGLGRRLPPDAETITTVLRSESAPNKQAWLASRGSDDLRTLEGRRAVAA